MKRKLVAPTHALLWGHNEVGQLGLRYSTKNEIVSEPRQTNIVWDQIECGSYFTVALKNGEVYTWGDGLNGQLGVDIHGKWDW